MTSPHENHLDNIFHSLGELKLFSVCQILLMGLIAPPTAYQILANVFICRDVEHRCASAPNDSSLLLSGLDEYDDNNLSISYQQCQIVVSYNDAVLKTEECIYGMAYEKPRDYSCVSQFDLVCDHASLDKLSQTLAIAGQGIGAIVFTIISDRFGRKPVLVGSNLGLLISGLIIAYAPNFALFAIFKLAAGAFQQGCFASYATIVMELLTIKNRRKQAFICGCAWGLSCMTLAMWAYLFRDYSWRTLQMAMTLVSLAFIPQFWWGKESLRWLIANGKSDESVSFIQCATKVNKTSFQETMQAYKRACSLWPESPSKDTATRKLTLLDILTVKRLFVNSFIMWLAWFTTALSLYAIYLTSGSLAGNPYVNFFLIACMEVINNFFLYYSLNRLGRKLTFVAVFFVVSSSITLSGVFRSLEENDTNSAFALIFSCAAMAGASAAFAFIYCYTPELFPTNVRNQALGVCSLVGRIGGMIAPFTGVLGEKAKWAPGVMIGGCALVVCLLSIVLPETKGRVLPQTIEDVMAWFSKDKTDKNKHVESGDANDESKECLNT